MYSDKVYYKVWRICSCNYHFGDSCWDCGGRGGWYESIEDDSYNDPLGDKKWEES